MNNEFILLQVLLPLIYLCNFPMGNDWSNHIISNFDRNLSTKITWIIYMFVLVNSSLILHQAIICKDSHQIDCSSASNSSYKSYVMIVDSFAGIRSKPNSKECEYEYVEMYNFWKKRVVDILSRYKSYDDVFLKLGRLYSSRANWDVYQPASVYRPAEQAKA